VNETQIILRVAQAFCPFQHAGKPHFAAAGPELIKVLNCLSVIHFEAI
jgi:hypothetical protein